MSPIRPLSIANIIPLLGAVLSTACSSPPDGRWEDSLERGERDGAVPEDLRDGGAVAGHSTRGAYGSPAGTSGAAPLQAPVTSIAAESQSGSSSSSYSECPQDMVEVQGDFCASVLQECLQWIDKEHMNRFGVVDPNMCAEFRSPSTCLSPKRVPMHFCIDRYEWPNRKGETPATKMTWMQANQECEAIGKRLCDDDEWTFACEGPDMKPYPYGDGYHRDSDVCNADHKRWLDPRTTPFEMLDNRAPSGSYEQCHSDWGVHDIVGNVDEWVFNTRGNAFHHPWVSGLMGGHWVYGVRNRCRAITDSHEPMFSYYVTGTRCCSDPTREKHPQ